MKFHHFIHQNNVDFSPSVRLGDQEIRKKGSDKFVSLSPNTEQPPYLTALTLIPFTNTASIKCKEESNLKKYRSQIVGLSYNDVNSLDSAKNTLNKLKVFYH